MTRNVLRDSAGDVVETEDDLRRGDASAHRWVTSILLRMSDADLAEDRRLAWNLFRWLTPEEQSRLREASGFWASASGGRDTVQP